MESPGWEGYSGQGRRRKQEEGRRGHSRWKGRQWEDWRQETCRVGWGWQRCWRLVRVTVTSILGSGGGVLSPDATCKHCLSVEGLSLEPRAGQMPPNPTPCSLHCPRPAKARCRNCLASPEGQGYGYVHRPLESLPWPWTKNGLGLVVSTPQGSLGEMLGVHGSVLQRGKQMTSGGQAPTVR